MAIAAGIYRFTIYLIVRIGRPNPTHPDHAYRAMRDRRSSHRATVPPNRRGRSAIPSLDYMSIKRKPIEIPPKVARQFAADMRALHADPDPIERDEIAANTGNLLLQHMPKGTKLPLADILLLFELMRSWSETTRPAHLELTHASDERSSCSRSTTR